MTLFGFLAFPDPGEVFGAGAQNLISVLIVLYGACLICLLVSYILRSVSLYRIAKRRKINHPGIAWVPVGYSWTLGSIVDQYEGTRGAVRRWRHVLLWAHIGLMALWMLFYAIVILKAAHMIQLSSQQAPFGEENLRLLIGIYLWLIPLSLGAGTVSILLCIGYYKLFESCNPKRALLLMLLFCLVPFAHSFCLLACSGTDLGMPNCGGNEGNDDGAQPNGGTI